LYLLFFFQSVMEAGGAEERMQEVASDINGTVEHDDVDDDEEQQQQYAVEDDEPLEHGDEYHEQSVNLQNGSSKDSLIEEKGSPNTSGGKSSNSGLVDSRPSSTLRLSPILNPYEAARESLVASMPGFRMEGSPSLVSIHRKFYS
jgi:hypothetical protein